MIGSECLCITLVCITLFILDKRQVTFKSTISYTEQCFISRSDIHQ